MEAVLDIGLIGCGVISRAYLRSAALLPGIRIARCADLDGAAAAALAEEFGLEAMTPAALLAASDVDIVLNLTPPAAHHAVGMAALAAGKHLYVEKPLCASLAEAAELLAFAGERGLRIGAAPDTFLGAGQQAARRLVDGGAIGRVLSGTAFFMEPGHEGWHPAPDFYYAAGGGPMFDMGPYYLTTLVNLLGTVARVTGHRRTAWDERRIGSGPREGEMVPVTTPTHLHAAIDFDCGALVTLTTSFDVPAHRHGHIELYGERASLVLPDPNHFGGSVLVSTSETEWREDDADLPWGDRNWRGLGLADMADAIREGRPHRTEAALAFHVLEVMDAILRSAASGLPVPVQSRCARPEAMA